jgi:hypothetical protein
MLAMADQIGGALAMRTQGVVHRDLKRRTF